jgi:hypothetical protein
LLFKLIVTLFFILFSLQISFAKDSNQKNNMFIDIKHGEAISKTSKIDDHDSTYSTRVIETDGYGMYGTKFWGVGLGKRISDKYNFITSIEQIDSNYYLGTITQVSGNKYTNVDTKFNAKSIIFEVERNFDLNPQYQFFINGGLGFSRFNFNKNDTRLISTSGNVYNIGLKTSNDDILTRFGFGISKMINENLQLVTSIDYTNRGEAKFKENDGDVTDFHIKSTNAVIKLRYFF